MFSEDEESERNAAAEAASQSEPGELPGIDPESSSDQAGVESSSLPRGIPLPIAKLATAEDAGKPVTKLPKKLRHGKAASKGARARRGRLREETAKAPAGLPKELEYAAPDDLPKELEHFEPPVKKTRRKGTKRSPASRSHALAVTIIGHLVASTLGLAIGYYILCKISPDSNLLNLPVPSFLRNAGNSAGGGETPASR